jgi:lysophospholipase L1-like esterase
MSVRAVVLSIFAAAALVGAPAAGSAPAPPSSMASIGDSITRAFDVCCWYGDHPAQSWSTGDMPFDGISSHYERLRGMSSGIAGHNYNDARTGARMRDAQGQAQTAVDQHAQYVTIELGANDACTSSRATMTSVADFRTQFAAAMSTLAAGLPAGAHVFVGSVPNVYRLWQLFHGNAAAQLVWLGAQICQSMLSVTNTEADRQAVVARITAFNVVLADVCGQYAFCRYDGGAVFDYSFTSGQVSKLDYFHPSISGQAALASITWQKSWWG